MHDCAWGLLLSLPITSPGVKDRPACAKHAESGGNVGVQGSYLSEDT